LSLGDLGSGKGGGFLATHTGGLVNIPCGLLPNQGDDLPGSAESQSGTKPAVEEELLKLIFLQAKTRGRKEGAKMQ
jgi:hypothetical protein